MKKNNWLVYHRLVKPLLLLVITVLTIIFLIWVFWFSNPTVTTPNSEFRVIDEQINS